MIVEPRATFADMKESTAEDWAIIASQRPQLVRDLPHQLLNHMKLMDGDYGGFPVDRLQHSLLTATLAQQDGRDEEYVVCALLHDIGDTLSPLNHPAMVRSCRRETMSGFASVTRARGSRRARSRRSRSHSIRRRRPVRAPGWGCRWCSASSSNPAGAC